eukprot:1299239-Prymnesium_polylepis.1
MGGDIQTRWACTRGPKQHLVGGSDPQYREDLVGDELGVFWLTPLKLPRPTAACRSLPRPAAAGRGRPVSYTHLTLPTICSV